MAPGTELATVDRRPHELKELGRLLGVGLSEATARIGELHQAIAGRAFAGVGAAAAPVRVMHDGISTGVYGAVRLAGSALLRVAGAVAAVTRPRGRRRGLAHARRRLRHRGDHRPDRRPAGARGQRLRARR